MRRGSAPAASASSAAAPPAENPNKPRGVPGSTPRAALTAACARQVGDGALHDGGEQVEQEIVPGAAHDLVDLARGHAPPEQRQAEVQM